MTGHTSRDCPSIRADLSLKGRVGFQRVPASRSPKCLHVPGAPGPGWGRSPDTTLASELPSMDKGESHSLPWPSKELSRSLLPNRTLWNDGTVSLLHCQQGAKLLQGVSATQKLKLFMLPDLN